MVDFSKPVRCKTYPHWNITRVLCTDRKVRTDDLDHVIFLFTIEDDPDTERLGLCTVKELENIPVRKYVATILYRQIGEKNWVVHSFSTAIYNSHKEVLDTVEHLRNRATGFEFGKTVITEVEL